MTTPDSRVRRAVSIWGSSPTLQSDRREFRPCMVAKLVDRCAIRHDRRMAQTARQRFSFREYIRLEEYSNVRHEFFDGVIYAMAGGTPRHAALAARVIGEIRAQLAGRSYEVFTSDLRVRVATTGLTIYPDVTVVCGPIETDPENASTIINPTVIVEVLRDSTEAYDRGEKLDQYRTISSLREILLIPHRNPGLEVWRRNDAGGWSESVAIPGQQIELRSIGCTLMVADLYRDLPVGEAPG